MRFIKWIFVFLLFHDCICQDTNHLYEQILQNAFQASSNTQAGLSSDDVLSLLGSVLRSSQDNIVSYLKTGLDRVLEGTTVNSTNNVCLKHTELFLDALSRREDWALRTDWLIGLIRHFTDFAMKNNDKIKEISEENCFTTLKPITVIEDSLKAVQCNTGVIFSIKIVIDAMGKPEPGLRDYRLNWVGNFDECIAIKATTYKDPMTKSGPEHPYTGKYCTAVFQLGDGQPTAFSSSPGVYIGMCLPDSCTAVEGIAFINAVTELLPLNMSIPQVKMTCKENSLDFTDKALAVSIAGAVFVGIIVLATVYDVFVQHILSKQTSKDKTKTCELAGENGMNNDAFNHEVSKDFSNDDMKVFQNGKEHNGFKDAEVGNERAVKAPSKPGTLGKLLLSFSVYSNAPKILNTKQPKGTLTCVNGVRFFSMSWVILGHTYGFGARAADNIATFLQQMMKRFTFQAVLNGTFSVDSFFVLSGLLVSYLSLREMKKRGGATKFNWILFYFHRYWRLTPPYMLLLMIYVPTIKYWGTGPAWPQAGIDIDECRTTWWKNLLYINNIVDSDRQCMGWSWYLANDMQFYVISPVMLIPLYYSPVFGGIACLLLVMVNFVCAGLISSNNEFNPNIMFNKDITEGMNKLYYTPWTRVGPYVVGIFTGYILYKTDCKVKMSKLLNMAGWAIATAMALVVLCGLYTSDGSPPNFSNGVSALYNATSRTAWGLSVAWVIFACATGYGGPVNVLLSWRGLIPLSRLTYCAYLVHPIVMYAYFFSRKALIHWDDVEAIYIFLGNMCVSYAGAFVISLALESPMMGIEKVLLGRSKNS